MADVAQTHIHPPFTWQAWHNLTSTVVLRGRRGTYGTGWRAWTARDAAPLLRGRRGTNTHIHRPFTWQAWQAWHNLTSTIVVAGVPLMVLGGALGLGLGARDAPDAAPLLRGRRGTNSHPPWFHVAGVAEPYSRGPFLAAMFLLVFWILFWEPWWSRFVGIRGAPRLTEACPRHAWQPQGCCAGCACVGQAVVCRASSLHLSLLRQKSEKNAHRRYTSCAGSQSKSFTWFLCAF